MSLDALRQACVKAFQDRSDAATSKAVNMRPRMASHDVPAMTAEEYAMFSIDALTEARVWLMAQSVITAEFKKLTQPSRPTDDVVPLKSKGNMY